MAETSVSQRWELRRCEACGHENIRPRRHGPKPEVTCPCGTSSFIVFDLLLVAREYTGDEAGDPTASDVLVRQQVGVPPTERSTQ
jgi:hypothetical protein